MFNHVYEMYGRHINLIPFNATGRRTAIRWRPMPTRSRWPSRIHAFASIGGPAQTSAYEEELARQHVFCMGCGDSATYGEITLNAPYQWANLPTADTSLYETIGYVVAKLNAPGRRLGRRPLLPYRAPYLHRGQRDLRAPRAGLCRADGRAHPEAARRPRAHGQPTDLQYTLDLTTLPTQAATIAEKLKTSGATSVIFAGDPIMPIYLTKACAQASATTPSGSSPGSC